MGLVIQVTFRLGQLGLIRLNVQVVTDYCIEGSTVQLQYFDCAVYLVST